MKLYCKADMKRRVLVNAITMLISVKLDLILVDDAAFDFDGVSGET